MLVLKDSILGFFSDLSSKFGILWFSVIKIKLFIVLCFLNTCQCISIDKNVSYFNCYSYILFTSFFNKSIPIRSNYKRKWLYMIKTIEFLSDFIYFEVKLRWN